MIARSPDSPGTRWNVGFKLTFLTFIFVGIIFTVLLSGIAYSTSRLLENRAVFVNQPVA